MEPQKDEVLEKVQAAIREQLSLSPENPLPEEADFYANLGGDSLDLAEVVMELEDEFDISAPDEGMKPPVTVGKIAGVVRKCLAARQAVEPTRT